MTTSVQIKNVSGLPVRIQRIYPDGSADGGKLLKPTEEDTFLVWQECALTVEELDVSTRPSPEAQAKEPLHLDQVLSPHEVYAQPVKSEEL